MGKSHKASRRSHNRSRKKEPDEDESAYSLLPDTTSPFSCCCVFYRYLLDFCLVLALSPFVINCFVEAIIFIIKFQWDSITWGKGVLAFLVLFVWLGLAVFGILCCIAVIRKGVFTRRLRQKTEQLAEVGIDEADSLA